MSKKKRKPSKAVLERMYWEKEMSTLQIGRKYGVNTSTALNWLKGHGIEIRPVRERLLRRSYDQEVVRLYVEENRATRYIEKKLGIERSTVYVCLKKAGIPLENRRDDGDNRKPMGYWNDPKTVEEEVRRFLSEKKLEILPSGREMRKLGRGDLAYMITKKLGGFTKARELLGQKQKRNSYGDELNDLEYTVHQAIEMISQENLESLPGVRKVRDLGYGGLANAIHNIHGGFPVFRELLRKTMGGKSNREEIEGILREYVS
jgi:hypothetical protein